MVERIVVSTDAELLAQLNAYGHLDYTVGDESWLACLDFQIDGDRVAYHVVVDGDSWVDTIEAQVVPKDKAPFDLPQYWHDVYCEQTGLVDPDAAAVNDRWNRDLRESLGVTVWQEIKEAIDHGTRDSRGRLVADRDERRHRVAARGHRPSH